MLTLLALLVATVAPLPTPPGARSMTPEPPTKTYLVTADSMKAADFSKAELKLVQAVVAVSSTSERRRLMFAIWRDRLLLFYGPRRAEADGGSIPFRVIGTCNFYFMDGYFGAIPGDGAGCATWKPSPADAAVLHSQFQP